MRKLLPLVLCGLVVFACGDDDEDDGAAPGVTTPDGGGADADGPAPIVEAGIDAQTSPEAGTDADAAAPFTLTAPWTNGGAIPTVHTCDGANTSPALSWSGAPPGTTGFALVVRDTSLTANDNYHWVIFDIPAGTTSLPAAIPRVVTPTTPAGSRQTTWSFGSEVGYGGPCPPSPDGPHTYEFTLYALNAAIGASAEAPETADALITAAYIARVSLTGTFDR